MNCEFNSSDFGGFNDCKVNDAANEQITLLPPLLGTANGKMLNLSIELDSLLL